MRSAIVQDIHIQFFDQSTANTTDYNNKRKPAIIEELHTHRKKRPRLEKYNHIVPNRKQYIDKIDRRKYAHREGADSAAAHCIEQYVRSR